ncbi:B-cell receptor-associated protein 31-like [Striga hermonthica]|uniref:Endoplasmic reticulum transmembrane protein n=1 Tax=Striga hermonthica TaxID=68872 RepID=A0A9N7NBD5_STRHE|nr:B-cell receptor-associated protein 31-like [Striga hermonthica]
MGLGLSKRGLGPILFDAVSATVFAVVMAASYRAAALQRRCVREGEEVSLTDRTFEASLMGFLLFLALMIRRLLNQIFEGSKPQVTTVVKALEEEMTKSGARIKQLETELIEKIKEANSAGTYAIALRKELTESYSRIKQLESELTKKTVEANSEGANAVALKKQSEGLFLEYDRLLEENMSLHSKLRSLDRGMSFSESKKVV